MALYTHRRPPRGRFLSPAMHDALLVSFLLKETLPLGDVLTEAEIFQAFVEEGATFADEEDAIFTPPLVLWALLSQTLFSGPQRSCLAAVARICALQAVCDMPALNSGPYCRARAKLPESLLMRLVRVVADGCEARMPPEYLGQGRHLKLLDGTTLSMADSADNQAAYPQQPQQQPRLGLPILQMLVLLSVATGMACDAATCPYAAKEASEPGRLPPTAGPARSARYRAGRSLLTDLYPHQGLAETLE